MSTIQALIVDIINSLHYENTVIVLKGFNKWLDQIRQSFLFGKHVDVYNATSQNLSEVVSRISTQNTETIFCLFEDLIKLSDASLGGIFSATGKNVIILENDFYNVYYPSGFLVEDFTKLKELHDKENDTYIQRIYGDIELQENNIYIAYNDLPFAFSDAGIKTICLSSLIENGVMDDDNGREEIIPDEYDALVLTDIVTRIIENGIGKASVLDDNLLKDNHLKYLVKRLEKAGVKIITRSFRVNSGEVDDDSLNAYLEILHRKNSSYNFRDLKIYDNPYENNELTDINQSVIINDIVQNALKAYHGEAFRDVFVTAPTGAGKSVMFQIPAIYLAEKYNLVTLVISPLIGLMNDQVVNIKTMTDKAATINSDYTPLQKEDTLNEIKNGTKSILYLSPEALLSNTDICSLIGDRDIGLIVVDEAHIVATWGKSFRPDYWYLGDFINKLRNSSRLSYKFPIATFTATATFGGDDNMYHDIIESLRMTPNKYIGNVRRDDIGFDIKLHKKDHAYREEKLDVASKTINELAKTDDKTLVYVPYTKHVDDLMRLMDTPEKAGRYFGGLSSGEKNETLKAINNGTKNVVIATKAFGMGIDIDDIKNVYHFAPTGNIPDYVQEIGRAARRPGMVGVASTDFFVEDFRYIRQLYGMSSIKNFQVVAVLRKIYQLYTLYNKRNFLVSPDDFAFIFADARPEDLDAKIKTTLLMIRKDFENTNSSNYPPVVFKPRSMFTIGYFMISDEMIPGLRQFGYLKYFKKVDLPRTYEQPTNSVMHSDVKVTMAGDIYMLDYKKIWENHYRDMSFSMFKYCFHMNELKDFNFRIGEKIKQEVILQIDAGNKTLNFVRDSLNTFLDGMIEVLNDLRQDGRYFSIDELAKIILSKGLVKKRYISEVVAGSFIKMIEKIEPYRDTLVKRPFSSYNSQTEKTRIETISYENRIKRLKFFINKFIFGDRHKLSKCTSPSDELSIISVQLTEMLELAFCSITAGEKPEFFIRVNNAYAIEKVINNPDYVSSTVANVGKKHSESCTLMQYFFTKLYSDETRWDFIEKYFLGQIAKSEIDQIKEDLKAKQ